MLRAFFKWGLCLLSAFSSPGIVQNALPAPTYTISLQARGPGRLRLKQAERIYTTRKEEVLYLSFPSNSSIEIEALSDSDSFIESLNFDQKPILEAKNQINWSKRFTLKNSLSIQATFSPSSFQSSISSLPKPTFLSSLSSLNASNSSLQNLSYELDDDNQKDSSNHNFPIQEELKENEENFNSSSLKNSNVSENQENSKDNFSIDSFSSSYSDQDQEDLSNLDLTLKEPDLDLKEDPKKSSLINQIRPEDSQENLNEKDNQLVSDTRTEKPKEDEQEDKSTEDQDEQEKNTTKKDQDESEESNEPEKTGEFLGYSTSDLKVLVQSMPTFSLSELFGLFQTSFEEVQSDYEAGFAANWIYLRIAMAHCLNLLDQVNQEGYLDQNLFDENPSLLDYTPQAILLQKPTIKSTMRKARIASNAKSSENISVVSAMLYQKISIFGNYISNYIWILSNNQHAFCASYLKAPPKKDATASSIKEVDSAALRKTLYYGFAGPENALGDWNHEQQIIITNDLVSLAYSNTCISQGELDGKMWRNGLKDIWDRIQALPDPQNYKAYIAEFPGTGLNHKNEVVEFQPLAFGKYEEVPEPEIKNPALQILKTTSDEIITNAGQQNYSLVGAKYEIRKGSSYDSGKYVDTLTIGKDLSSEVLEVESAGTYWAKEVEAPKGYALDESTHRIEVDVASHRQAPVRILVYDSPQYCPIDLLLKKFTDQTNIPLKNAIFELCYYAVDPKTFSTVQNVTPVGTWQVKTDDNGEIHLDREHIYLASYDFPRAQEDPSKVVFPIGVLTIQEIQPPLGYALNDTLYTIPLNPNADQSTQTSFNVYQAPTIFNRPAKIFLKKENESHKGLPGAEFSVQDPQGNVQVISLDDQGSGEVEFNQSGTWTIWESKPPVGYKINSTKATFQVTSSSIASSCPEKNAAITFYQNTLTIQDVDDCYGLKICKKSPTNKPLSGAVFELYTIPSISKVDERTQVFQETTDENGLATFGNLIPGKIYILSETKAPNGYILSEKDDKPEYLFWAQKSSNTTSTHFESGYGLILKLLNPLDGNTKLMYIDKDPNQYGFSWQKENELVNITFDCINEPISGDDLPHTGSSSTLIALALGSFLALKGLRKE